MKLRKPDFLKSTLERYRDALQEAMQTKATVYREKSIQKKLPMVYTMVFDKAVHHPATAFSYGVSFATTAEQPERIELCLQTRSNAREWLHVVGYLANQLRGDCPFQLGQIIRMGQTISPDSKLDAFLVVPPIDENIPVSISDRKKTPPIRLVELVPVYAEETPKILRLGVKAFLKELSDRRLDPARGML